MGPADPRILTINGGSSSISFAAFEARNLLQKRRRITSRKGETS